MLSELAGPLGHCTWCPACLEAPCHAVLLPSVARTPVWLTRGLIRRAPTPSSSRRTSSGRLTSPARPSRGASC